MYEIVQYLGFPAWPRTTANHPPTNGFSAKVNLRTDSICDLIVFEQYYLFLFDFRDIPSSANKHGSQVDLYQENTRIVIYSWLSLAY